MLGTWKIKHLIIDSGNRIANKEYLIDTTWIKSPDWNKQSITLTQTRPEIEDCPEFDPAIPVNREDEVKLFDYYGKAHRWIKLS